MRRYFTLFVLLLTGIMATAQDLKITKIELNPKLQTALVNQELDPVGQRKCAVLHVITEGLTPEERNYKLYFQLDNAHSIVKTVKDGGEIQLYVPDGTVRLTVKSEMGNYRCDFRDHGFKDGVESLKDYNVVIHYDRPFDRPNPDNPVVATQQWLVFNVTPKDALVWVDEEPWPVVDGVAQKNVDFGTYDYRIEASDYHNYAGKIKVDDSDNKVILNVDLTPAFGFLKIEGDNGILSKASIYIDKDNGADALRTPRQLPSGQHTVRIVHQKYKPFERKVNIEDGQTFTLNANLAANFSTVTLKVDADAEIWVNNEKKGTRTWTGDLEAGNYTIECRMENHRTSVAKHTITDNMSGQTISLSAPTPIMGRLVVSSTPSLAKIFIDGQPKGETPININQILIGQHSLRIEKAGCAPVSKTITIEEGKTLTLEEKLDTGRNLTVETDRKGDKVYVDREYVGETPLRTSVGFGTHTVKAVRGKDEQSKDIEVKIGGSDIELFFEFGRLISITTDRDGDAITIDGESVGTSPLRVDLAFGQHTIHAQREKKYEDKDIVVSRTGGQTEHHLVLHGETAKSFVARGVNFILLNGAVSSSQQRPTFGLTVGQVKQLGWYASFITNFNFKKAELKCDADGVIIGNEGLAYSYTGNEFSRWSATAGGLCKLGCPLYLYAGIGYGQSATILTTEENILVEWSDHTFKGLTIEAGLMAHIKHVSISAGITAIGTDYMECKVGIGYCFKKK